MFDKSAIISIRDMAVAELSNTLLEKSCDHQNIVVPNDYKVIGLENYQDAPYRFRGKFSTTLLAEFAAYINACGTIDSGIFVDPEQVLASAVINMGSDTQPMWGDHKAALSLKKLPEFVSVLERNGMALSQQDLVDFCEDQRECIQFIDASRNNLDFSASINAIRRLTISATQNNEFAVGNFNASHSSMDAIEVKAAGAEIPLGFIFNCIPYDGFSARPLLCQFRASTDVKTVTLRYRVGRLDNEINKISQEFKQLLQEKITVNCKFYVGTMRYQD